MLSKRQDVVLIQVCGNVAEHIMFHDLACDAGEGDGPVVTGIGRSTFLVDGSHLGGLPQLGYFTSVVGLLEDVCHGG